MIIYPSSLKQFVRKYSLRLFNVIENNGITDFSKNGEEYFLHQLLLKLKNKSGSSVIFDIGSNIGNYSKIIVSQAAKCSVDIELHLFEPMTKCFNELEDKFRDKDYILNNFAVSDKTGKASIFFDREKSSIASLYKRNLRDSSINMDKSETIKTRRMDEYIEDKGISHIDFVKIDVEGHELMALKGFGKFLHSNFIDLIQFEYGGTFLDSHTSLRDVYKLLNDRGFKIAKVMPKGLELRKYQPDMENYSYSNYIAINKEYLEN